VAEGVYRVELTASLLARLDAIDALLAEADAAFDFDDLLVELRATVIPNLARFPRIGRRYLDNPPQSAEALAQLATLPAGAASALREYLHGDYLMLYAAMDASATVYLLSIRQYRQLSFDFARLWPGTPPKNQRMTIPLDVLPRDNLVYPVERLQLYYEVTFGREKNALVGMGHLGLLPPLEIA
jgi:hypothetical protein